MADNNYITYGSILLGGILIGYFLSNRKKEINYYGADATTTKNIQKKEEYKEQISDEKEVKEEDYNNYEPIYYLITINGDGFVKEMPSKNSPDSEKYSDGDIVGFVNAQDWHNIYKNMTDSFPVKIYLDKLELTNNKKLPFENILDNQEDINKIKTAINKSPIRYLNKKQVNLSGGIYKK